VYFPLELIFALKETAREFEKENSSVDEKARFAA
jgi:hypothetical protein